MFCDGRRLTSCSLQLPQRRRKEADRNGRWLRGLDRLHSLAEVFENGQSYGSYVLPCTMGNGHRSPVNGQRSTPEQDGMVYAWFSPPCGSSILGPKFRSSMLTSCFLESQPSESSLETQSIHPGVEMKGLWSILGHTGVSGDQFGWR
jgi:hypothetical protein